MRKKLITLKVDETEHLKWQEQAKRAGVSFSELVRLKMNGGVVAENSSNSAVRPVSDASVLQRGVVTAGGPVEPRKGGVCKHGTAKGYNCWQCGGIAKVGEG